MKSFLVAATTLYSVVTASPLAPWEKMTPPPDGTQFFQLQVKSSRTALANQWLTLKSGSIQYTLSSAKSDATEFFTTMWAPTGTYAVHNSDDSRQVVLQGSSAVLLYLNDATNPTNNNIPKGQLMEWATFTLDNNVLGVKDGSALPNRTFAAVKNDSNYTLALYDGASTTTQTVTPITINVVKSTK